MSFKPIFLASALVFATVFGATSYDGCSIDAVVNLLQVHPQYDPNPLPQIWADAITAANRAGVTVHGVFSAEGINPISDLEVLLPRITSAASDLKLYAYQGSTRLGLWTEENLQYLRNAGAVGVAFHQFVQADRDGTRANMTAIGWTDGKILLGIPDDVEATAAPTGPLDIWGRAFTGVDDIQVNWTNPTTTAESMVYASGLADVADFCARVYAPAKAIGVEIIGGSGGATTGDQWGLVSDSLWLNLTFPDICEPCSSSAATSTSATAPATTTTAAPTSPETSPQSTTSPGPVETTTMMANHSTTPDISPAPGLFGTVAVVASLVAVLF
jgi:hypothetical protein